MRQMVCPQRFLKWCVPKDSYAKDSYDDAIFIDDDRLAKSEFTNRRRDNIDGLIIQARLVFVRTQLRELPLFDLHWTTFPEDKEAERVGRWLGRESFNTSHCADGSSGMTPEA